MDIIHDVTRRGDVESLRRILATDPAFPLADPKFTCLLRTPLHVAAMHHYVDFAAVIVNTDPRLAMEVDSQGFTPLHLASTRYNVEMVRVLLNANTDACLVQDHDGRTPLHLAAMRNEVEVLELLIQSRPEAIHQRLLNTNETILHLCVIHNSFHAMEKLVDCLVSDRANLANYQDRIFVNSVDSDGNTILHLAAQKKRMKMVIQNINPRFVGKTRFNALVEAPMLKYLLDSSEIGVDVNIRNTTPGQLRALDMLDEYEMNSLGNGFFDIHITREVPQQSTTSSNKLKERLNALTIVATLIAGIAFQAVINPPGGVFQDDSKIDSVKDPVMFTHYLQNVMGTRMSKGFQSYIDKLPPQKGTTGNITADEIITYRANFVKNLLTAAKSSKSYTSSVSPYMSQKLAPGIVLEEDWWMNVISKYNITYGGGSGFSPYLIRYAGTAILAYRAPKTYEVYMVLNTVSLAVCGLTILLVTFDAIRQNPSRNIGDSRIVYLEVLMAMAVACIAFSYLIVFRIISPPFYLNNNLVITIVVAVYGISLLGPIATSIYTLEIFRFHYFYTQRYHLRLRQYAHSRPFFEHLMQFCVRSYHRNDCRSILVYIKLFLYVMISIGLTSYFSYSPVINSWS